MFTSTATIFAGVIGATGLTVLRDLLTDGTFRMQPVIGGFILGTILLTVAFASVPVAASLAMLVLITSILVNGSSVLSESGL